VRKGNEPVTATVVVVYTGGAAAPIELAADAEGYTLLFAAPVGALRDGLAEMLAAVGDLVDVTDEAAGAAVLAARRPAGIVTLSDRDLPLTARLAARLGLPYHSASAVLAATDKYVQRQRLRDAGLRVPRFCALDRPDQVVAALTAVGTPAVLKPRRGAGSRHTYRLDDPETALRHATGAFAAGECDAFVVEEMLVGCPSVAGLSLGDYASVEMLMSCGAVAYRTITGRLPLQQPFRERGFFLPGRLPADVAAAAYQLAEAAWRALGLGDGWIHVEMKLTADGPVVIEVNGRLGGYIAVLLYRSGGVQAVRMALDVAVGRRPVVPVGDPSAIAFGYQILPPVGDWRLTSWGSVADLADRSDIVSVILTAAPGDPVDWRLGSEGTLGVVEGVVERPEALLAAVRAIERTIADEVVFSPA
jgi:biotin carboxylase